MRNLTVLCTIMVCLYGCTVLETSPLPGDTSGQLFPAKGDVTCDPHGGVIYYLPKNLVKLTVVTGGYEKSGGSGNKDGAPPGVTQTATNTTTVNMAATATPTPTAGAKESPKPAGWAELEKLIGEIDGLKPLPVPNPLPDEPGFKVLPAIPDLSMAYILRHRHTWTRSDDIEVKLSDGLLSAIRMDTREETPAILLELSEIAVQAARLAAAFEGFPAAPPGMPEVRQLLLEKGMPDNAPPDFQKSIEALLTKHRSQWQQALVRRLFQLSYQRTGYEFVFDPSADFAGQVQAFLNGVAGPDFEAELRKVQKPDRTEVRKSAGNIRTEIEMEINIRKAALGSANGDAKKKLEDEIGSFVKVFSIIADDTAVNSLLDQIEGDVWSNLIATYKPLFTAFSARYEFKLEREPLTDGYVQSPADLTLPKRVRGIIYRTAATYKATLHKHEPGVGSTKVRPVFSEAITIPNGGAMASVPLTAGWFVTTTHNVGFDKGYLTSVSSKRPSEVLGFLAMWPDALRNLASIPGEMLQVKVDYSNKTNALIESNNKTIELQNKMIELLETQQDLLTPPVNQQTTEP